MAAVDIGARDVPPVPAADELDDLFDYDVGDVFRNVDTNIDVSTPQKSVTKIEGRENLAGLGIDQEIKVIKKRAPVPKLDENRLLGPSGIPKLRRIAKDRLRFRGKGHEFSDVTRLLNVYQLWLDELYPRAKFADGLAIIEKLGHTKRMQTMRREWINQGKPKDEPESAKHFSVEQGTKAPDPRFTNTVRVETPKLGSDKDSLYGAIGQQALVEESRKRIISSTESLFVSDDEGPGDQPPEDDLDALLAKDQTISPTSIPSSLQNADTPRKEENFDDEMEAMAGIDDPW